MLALSEAFMVIVVLVVKAGHEPEASTMYSTVYVPGVLLVRFTKPVLELIIKPAVEVKIPPVAPVIVTLADDPALLQ